MFATVLGPFPDPVVAFGAASPEERVRAIVAAQEAAGLGLLTDGGARSPDRIAAVAAALEGFEPIGDGPPVAGPPGAGPPVAGPPVASGEPRWRGPITVEAWRSTAALTELPVKQTLVGPYTMARHCEAGPVGRARLTIALAEALHEELVALAGAGCPVVQVDEDDATLIGLDPSERRLFVDAQRRLVEGVETHLSLAIAGGDAEAAGAATIFDAPYRSYLFDLIAGPDNWRLIAVAPGDRGIVCGAIDPAGAPSGQLEALIWAARYAASTGGRGLARVGIAPAAGLERVPWDVAVATVGVLGEAARLATATREELESRLDPRALDAPWSHGRTSRPGGAAG